METSRRTQPTDCCPKLKGVRPQAQLLFLCLADCTVDHRVVFSEAGKVVTCSLICQCVRKKTSKGAVQNTATLSYEATEYCYCGFE
jgi:hypothetical protein